MYKKFLYKLIDFDLKEPFIVHDIYNIDKNIIFDFKNKFTLHLCTTLPIYIPSKLNLAFDAFVISMIFNLSVNSYFFFLTLGYGLK